MSRSNLPVPGTRTTLRSTIFASLLGVLIASPLFSQASPEVRPGFRLLRFEEDWSAPQEPDSARPLDSVKHLPIRSGGRSYLSVGGQLRYRGEGVSDFMLTAAPGRDDGFGLYRAFLHGDLHLGRRMRIFVEGKHAQALGRELPGGRRPVDHDEWELQNLFVDVTCCGDASTVLTARLGRQELLLGSQRLVSPLEWANSRRTFDGVRVIGTGRGLTFDAFWTRPVPVHTERLNRADASTAFWGGTLRPTSPARGISWEAYVLVLRQDSVSLWGHEGEHERVTAGGRLQGTLLSPSTSFDLEGGWQEGNLAGGSVRAFFVASELRRRFAGLPTTPVAAVGLDYASGDDDPTDSRVGTFHQLFPLGHAYAGHMDLLGRQNLIEARGVVTASPARRVQTRVAVHHFLRARREDAVYGVGGAILRPASGLASREIGAELDVTVGYQAGRHLRLDGGYDHFFPGSFMEAGPDGADDSDWIYASTSLTF